MTDTGGKYKLVLCEVAYFRVLFLYPMFFCFGRVIMSGIMSLSLIRDMSTTPLLLILRWCFDYSVEAPAVIEPTYSDIRFFAALIGRLMFRSFKLVLEDEPGGFGISGYIFFGSIPVIKWMPLRTSIELNRVSVILFPELKRGEVRMLLIPLALLPVFILLILLRCLFSIAITFSFSLGSKPINIKFFNLYSS